MPRTTVTNTQLMGALVELRQQVQARDEPLEARLDEVTVTLTDVVRRMDGLERTVVVATSKDAKADSCPYRDDIVLGANNRGRISALEKGQHALELQVIKWGAAGGAAISTIVAIADRLITAIMARGGA